MPTSSIDAVTLKAPAATVDVGFPSTVIFRGASLGSRTSPSFSYAGSTQYVPAGTGLIVKLVLTPLTFGPRGTAVRKPFGSTVSGTRITDVASKPPAFTKFSSPVTVDPTMSGPASASAPDASPSWI